MKRFNANIRPIQSALQQAPEVFDALSMHATLDILFHVIDDVVSEVGSQSHVSHKLISHQFGTFRDSLANRFVGDGLVAVGRDFCPHLAATFQHPVDNSFRPVLLAYLHFDSTVFVHVTGLAADEGFVNLNRCSGTADLCAEEFVLHSQTNPLQHEPSRFLAHLHIACDLVGTDTVFAVGQHPRRGKPLVQRNRTILVDRPDLDRELALGMVTATLPSAPLRVELAYFFRPTTGTNDLAILPAPYRNVINTVIRIREVDNRFLKASGLRFHCVFHEQNIAKITGRVKVINAVASQPLESSARSSRQKKIAPTRSCALERFGQRSCTLRQVITERRIEQIFGSMRRSGGASTRRTERARPGIAANVGILRTKLHPALRTVIGFDPEAERSLDYTLRLATTGQAAKSVTAAAGHGFLVAIRIVKLRRTIPYPLASAAHGGVVKAIMASHVILATVEIDIDFRIVKFQRGQTLIGTQESQSSIRVDGGVRQAGRGVAAQSVAIKGMKAEIDVLVVERNACIPSQPATVLRSVIRAGRETECTDAAAQARVFALYAGIDAVTEPAPDCEYFIVAEPGLKDRLENEIRRCVERIVRQG